MFQLLVIIVLLLSSVGLGDEIRCLEKEREVLEKLKDEVIDEHGRLSSWGNEQDCCKWSGVRCDNQTYRIVELDLSGYQLKGRIPISFGNLTGLSRLDLSSNQLTGKVPHFTFQFNLPPSPPPRRLIEIVFYPQPKSNRSSLSSLEYLNLSSNHFEDIITESHFLNLSQLRVLDLSSNPGISFSFSLGWNPPFQLTRLSLQGCRIGPHFPDWLRTQRELRILDISNAEISGTFPVWFWEQISLNMVDLNVSRNNFLGVLPEFSSNLLFLDLSYNNLNGSLPILPHNAFELDLSNNKFSGPITNLCNGTLWLYLDLSNNLLSGEIPGCSADGQRLVFLNLANNNFSGDIPSLTTVSNLHLQNNRFTGEIPLSLMNCSLLRVIDLSGNELTGKLPSWMGDHWPGLAFLSLKSNNFFGGIPSNMCHLTRLQVLDLSSNNISGSIPKCLNNLTAMVVGYESSFIVPLGRGPEGAVFTWKRNELEFTNTLKLVKFIDLSNNNLAGDIPAEITSLVALVGLNLSRNSLSGMLPPNIGQLRSLDFLDLSRNHFHGSIPDGLSHVDSLGVLDLSSNNFSGRIPQSNHFQTFDASAFEGNLGLCGLPLTKACPGDEKNPNAMGNPKHEDEEEEGDDKLISDGFYISMAVGFISAFWAVCGSLWFIKSWRIAFFKLWNTVTDWLYVKAAIRTNQLKEAFAKF